MIIFLRFLAQPYHGTQRALTDIILTTCKSNLMTPLWLGTAHTTLPVCIPQQKSNVVHSESKSPPNINTLVYCEASLSF